MSKTHPNHQRIIDALRRNPEPLIMWAAARLVALGAKVDWCMEDNYETTESLAHLPVRYGLPSAGDQGHDALAFYGAAAHHLGWHADIAEEE